MAEPTDYEIIDLAKSCGIVTGENLRRGDDYLFRSMGTPTNVYGRNLIEFARAARAFQKLNWETPFPPDEDPPVDGVKGAPRVNPACGVHGLIPCEGARCICAHASIGEGKE